MTYIISENCETADCGVNRRCIMTKNEQPKCVCSPNCKKAKKLNNKINNNNKNKAKDRQNKRQLHLKNLNKNANLNVTDDDIKKQDQRSLGVSNSQRRHQQQSQTSARKKLFKIKKESESDMMPALQPRLNKKRQNDNHGVRHKNKKLANNSRSVATKRRHINLLYQQEDQAHEMNLNDTESVLQITEKRIRGGDLMNNFIAMSENNFINDNSILVSNGSSPSVRFFFIYLYFCCVWWRLW